MKSTQNLPDGYKPAGTLVLTKDFRVLLGLNIAGLFLLAGFSWLFFRMLFILRPLEASQGIASGWNNVSDALKGLAGLILITILVVILHEAVHGLFFWIFTESRPVFKFHGAYASASAPGWYIPRGLFIIIGLSPLVFLSLAGLLLLTTAPANWFLGILLFMIFNASGAVGDIYAIFWLLTKKSDCLALDQSDSISVFAPGE